MKNLILSFAIMILIVSCQKDINSNSRIVIKGKISQATMKSAGTKSENALPLSDAKKIFVANIDNGQLRSEFIDITDGSFTATAGLGKATALVFLDANNKYIGTLSTRGLNLLPLSHLMDGENTSIDLEDLTLQGTSVIPSHDPFGKEIIITDDEINRLKEVDGFFESLSKNIDANNDNIPDVMADRQLFIKTRFWVNATHWGVNNTSPAISSIDQNSLGYTIELDGGTAFSKPNSIVLSGPVGNPYNDIGTQFINANGMGGFYAGVMRSGEFFEKGTYSINIDGYNCTMEYSNNDAAKNQLYVLPTLNTNSDGKVVSIKLEYRLPDGRSIDPVNILTDLMIQFTDDSGNQYFNSPWIKNEGADLSNCNCISGIYTYTPDSPIDISHLKGICIPYNDLLGNTYFINWSK